MVGVAQLVERRTVAPNVVGSNPISHPNFSKFTAMKEPETPAEIKRLTTRTAIFMLGGAPRTHEFLPEYILSRQQARLEEWP